MKGFKKLLLTTAILAASSSAMAMQAMDDESLSSTTGQDGLTVTINSSVITDMDITWVDRDGHAGFATPGAVLINNIGTSITNLDILVDAGSNATDGAQLNVSISTADDVIINLNDGAGNGTTIQVAEATAAGSSTSGAVDIVKFSSTAALTLTGGFAANLKLGNRSAGQHFMTIDVTNPVDITLTGLTILDAVSTAANGAGNDVGIGIGTLVINDLNLHNQINVVDAGLEIGTVGTTIGEIAMEGIVLGDQVTAVSLGDVYLSGMDVNSTITISGH